jgi:hypothetical protein
MPIQANLGDKCMNTTSNATVRDTSRCRERYQCSRLVDHSCGIRGDHGTEDRESGIYEVVAHVTGRHGSDNDRVGRGDFVERPAGIEGAGAMVVHVEEGGGGIGVGREEARAEREEVQLAAGGEGGGGGGGAEGRGQGRPERSGVCSEGGSERGQRGDGVAGGEEVRDGRGP